MLEFWQERNHPSITLVQGFIIIDHTSEPESRSATDRGCRAMSPVEEAPRSLEDGSRGKEKALPPRRTGHSMSSSSLLRKRSDRSMLSKVRSEPLRRLLANLQEVFLGTKLFPLFPAIPLAIAAHGFDFGRVCSSYYHSSLSLSLYLYLSVCWLRR